MLKGLATALLGLAVLFWAPIAAAEEGMWTFDAIPAQRVRETVGMNPGPAWLDRLRGATVRLTTGCSAALVSREGLAVTSAHCVLNCAQAAAASSDAAVLEGFLTEVRAEERICPGVQAEILVGIVDATDFLTEASAGKYGDAFVQSRQEAIAQAERRVCADDPRLRCQVVSFFGGGRLKVYKYRAYPDVRLVFAPEYAAAFFGGDADNFSFPRFGLDCAFLRLYEHGRPAATPQSLTWSTRPPRDGEPVFIAGNPGLTERNATVAELLGERDVDLPTVLAEERDLRSRLEVFAAARPENAARVADRLFDHENLIKVYKGRLALLQDTDFIARRQSAETTLRARTLADRRLATDIGDPWTEIAAVQALRRADFAAYRALEGGAGGGSRLFVWARMLVRGALERGGQGPGRLPEYAPSRQALLRKSLLEGSSDPPDLEAVFLSAWLSSATAALPAGSPALATLLRGESPQARADDLARNSELSDPSVREMLWDGGLAAIQASQDPMIRLALAIDPQARAARTAWETDVAGPVQRAGERIARARFALERDEPIYPDANFSPRFTWGRVAGWEEGAATIGPFTTFGGLFARSNSVAPRALSPRWIAAAAGLDPSTVFNFTTTNDIAGGNSGSPVVDAKGAILGVAFDGNAAAIGGEFFYDPVRNRAVALATVAITEALTKVYGQTALVKELGVR